MKILCHVGPWCKDQFSVIAEGVSPSANVFFLSNFTSIDDFDFRNRVAKRVKEVVALVPETDSTLNVIARCRLLRGLPLVEAVRLEYSTRIVVGEILDELDIDLFICESVDQYLHQILFEECHKRGIKSVGLIRTFVNGYYRFSAMGEYHCSREVSVDEIDRVRSDLLQDDYIPNNLVALKRSLSKTYYRIMFSNMVRVFWFFILCKVPINKYHYHYRVSYENTRRESLHLFPMKDLGLDDWRERLSKEKLTIFIPLQHFPEATIDYWAHDIGLVNYESTLLKFVERYAKHFNIVFKEHPGVWGYRKPSFYRRFDRFGDDVIFAPTESLSNECLKNVDAVVTYTGSIGFEAMLRGIPVLSFTEPYYSNCFQSLFKTISLDADPEEIELFLRNSKASRPEDISGSVSKLLQGFRKGVFRNNGSFDKRNPVHIEEALNIGIDIKEELVSGTI